MSRPVLLAVPNISEGRRPNLVEQIAGAHALDVHIDSDHHRSVITLGAAPDEVIDACTGLVDRAVDLLDIREHDGVHPRFGVVDVLPLVPFGTTESAAIRAGDELARHAIDKNVPVFRYGRERSLPELRNYLRTNAHDVHPTAGVVCIGVRHPLVAFNVNLKAKLGVARTIARRARELPKVRALGFDLLSRGLSQVSMNLIEPTTTGPQLAFRRVVELAAQYGADIADAEVVGLVPAAIEHELREIPLRKHPRTIESALETTAG